MTPTIQEEKHAYIHIQTTHTPKCKYCNYIQ